MMNNQLKLNQSWINSDFIVLDLEGTGFQHKEKEGIVEIAAIKISKGKILDEYYYKMINPEIKIPPMVSKIHGLKNEDLINEPIFESLKDELFELLNNKILIGHNVNVDYRLLKLKMPNYEPSLLLDTKKISKYFWRNEGKHGLDQLIKRFKIEDKLINLPIKRGRHSAYYDTYATTLLFLLMINDKFSNDALLSEIIKIARVDINKNIQGTLF